MNEKKPQYKPVRFKDYLAKQLRDPVFRQHYEEYGKQLEVAYQILQLRKKQGLSQARLARKLGTNQSNIARMESGQQNFTQAED
ncbi:MAG: helix-turn-helix transcriptional regulator [Candidatus Wildermuthbacteria bacterium]|nr:helix-turn-helix transcriptional regulator [Candidatus Wildermuthbacteria bacterium]